MGFAALKISFWVLAKMLWLAFYAVVGVVRLPRAIVGLGHALVAVVTGGVRCTCGNNVPLSGTFVCTGCDFTYEGSAFSCPNPDCPAPSASDATCACGLSVQSPFRF